MSRHVRSRLDIRLGRTLRIGQHLRHHGDSSIWRIDQLYRTDCQALLEHENGARQLTPFADIRTDYDLVIPLEQEAAA